MELHLFPAALVHFSNLVTKAGPVQYLSDDCLANLSNITGANSVASQVHVLWSPLFLLQKHCYYTFTVRATKPRRLTLNTSLMGAETKMDDCILFPMKSSYIFW